MKTKSISYVISYINLSQINFRVSIEDVVYSTFGTKIAIIVIAIMQLEIASMQLLRLHRLISVYL